MIDNYLITFLMCLGLIGAGLAAFAVRPRQQAVAVPAAATVVLGVVCAALVLVNWVGSA